MAILLYDLTVQGDLRISPFCWRTKYALAHKGLAYETRPVAMTDIPSIAGGAHKTVPILEDGDQIVGDSWAIADYLDRAYPDRPAIFGSPGERGLCQFVEAWMFSSMALHLMHIYLKDIHDLVLEKDRAHFRATREARLGRTLEEAVAGREARVEPARAAFEPVRVLITRLGQPFLSGERAGYADYMLAGFLLWIAGIGAGIGTVPLLAAGDPLVDYFERVRDLHGGVGRSSPVGPIAA